MEASRKRRLHSSQEQWWKQEEMSTLKSGTVVEAGRDVWAATCGEDRKFGLPHSQVNVQTNKTEAKAGGFMHMPFVPLCILLAGRNQVYQLQC
jgi:hypothetical protein